MFRADQAAKATNSTAPLTTLLIHVPPSIAALASPALVDDSVSLDLPLDTTVRAANAAALRAVQFATSPLSTLRYVLARDGGDGDGDESASAAQQPPSAASRSPAANLFELNAQRRRSSATSAQLSPFAPAADVTAAGGGLSALDRRNSSSSPRSSADVARLRTTSNVAATSSAGVVDAEPSRGATLTPSASRRRRRVDSSDVLSDNDTLADIGCCANATTKLRLIVLTPSLATNLNVALAQADGRRAA